MTRAIALGFILYITQSGVPVNHAPWHVFDSKEACEADRAAWHRIAPEWETVCKAQKQ